ncbi:hypothetical protein LCGC14_0476970 [marine sediment metagenome]|uniref:Phage replisome organiser N-terminal domain-containing protein n=1 Tax=marine sediment metagenome TaxID=412755 RepID=A0A0F9SAG1_9ZZZZ
MPTKGWKRTWVKFFVTGWLHGSIRWQLEPDERSVWADLICLAGQCGHEGAICDNDGEALPRDFMANQLNIKQTLLDRTIAKSIHDNRLEEVDGCLSIVNWSSYQSEYERQKISRQKPYRQDKKVVKESFAEIVLSGRKAELEEVAPDEFAIKDHECENDSIHSSPDTIKVIGEHPDGTLIFDIKEGE